MVATGQPALAHARWMQDGVVPTTLFCLAAFRPGTSEMALLSSMQKQGVGVYACDGHMVFSASTAQLELSTTESLLDRFIRIWNQIFADGRYADYDWTVRADMDTIIIPSRLRLLLNFHCPGNHCGPMVVNSATLGSGPVEAVSRGAMHYLSTNWKACANGGVLGDDVGTNIDRSFEMSACLQALLVQVVQDHGLVESRFGATACDDEHAAFRPIHMWGQASDCLRQASPRDFADLPGGTTITTTSTTWTTTSTTRTTTSTTRTTTSTTRTSTSTTRTSTTRTHTGTTTSTTRTTTTLTTTTRTTTTRTSTTTTRTETSATTTETTTTASSTTTTSSTSSTATTTTLTETSTSTTATSTTISTTATTTSTATRTTSTSTHTRTTVTGSSTSTTATTTTATSTTTSTASSTTSTATSTTLTTTATTTATTTTLTTTPLTTTTVTTAAAAVTSAPAAPVESVTTRAPTTTLATTTTLVTTTTRAPIPAFIPGGGGAPSGRGGGGGPFLKPGGPFIAPPEGQPAAPPAPSSGTFGVPGVQLPDINADAVVGSLRSAAMNPTLAVAFAGAGLGVLAGVLATKLFGGSQAPPPTHMQRRGEHAGLLEEYANDPFATLPAGRNLAALERDDSNELPLLRRSNSEPDVGSQRHRRTMRSGSAMSSAGSSAAPSRASFDVTPLNRGLG